MKKIYFPSLFCFLFIGCLSLSEQPTEMRPETVTPSSHLFPSELIRERVQYLDTIIDDERSTKTQVKIAADLKKSYMTLQRVLREDSARAEYRMGMGRLIKSLVSLETAYFKKSDSDGFIRSVPFSYFISKKKAIINAFQAQEYKGVINHCLELKTELGPDALDAEIGLLLAVSLSKEKMASEAVNVIDGVMPAVNNNPDLNRLMIEIALLHLNAGHRDRAIELHHTLADNLNEQRAGVEALGKRISSASTGDPQLSVPVEITPSAPLEHQPFVSTGNPVLDHVEQLIQQRKFNEAWDFLTLKNDDGSFSSVDAETLKQARTRLEAAQESYLEETIAMISKKKNTLEYVKKLFEEERYEAAISSLDSISEQMNNEEIDELRTKAVSRFINRERNRAARLFLSAKKTDDLSKKEYYLRNSWDILNSIIEKYPESPLSEKIRSHMKKVTEELEKI